MILLIDAGNTRYKWALAYNGEIRQAGVAKSSVKEVRDVLHPNSIDEILISSVVGAQVSEGLGSSCKELFGVAPYFAKVQKSFKGVTVAYQNVGNLGVDRWLALLAGKQKAGGGCVVIDAGTTITVDYLDDNGCHSGGLIVPGVSMMRGALFENTAAVKVESLTLPQKWSPGRDTMPCVSNGLSAMLKGFLEQVTGLATGPTKILVTGGDADLVNSLIASSAEVHDHLVLEGLLSLKSP